MTYADRLEAAVAAKRSPCIAGLDPHLHAIPPEFAAVHDTGATRAERAAAVGDYLAATRLTRSALSAHASGINGVSPVMQNAWGNASFCLQELGRTDELRRLQQDWASITTPGP